jgi:hypothetical protein
MTHEKEEKSKVLYEKPRLRTIPLVADEVLAVSCKTASGAPGKSSPSFKCGFSPCSVPGVFGS